jgi:23S rRNA (pseudouridine1915-N3)-methyltransferase
MKFLVVVVGKGKFPFVQAGVEHYLKATGHMAEIDWLELKDHASNKEQECEAILEALKKRKILGDGKNRVILLDERGKQYSSPELAQELRQRADSGTQRFVFVIGGAYGFTDAMRAEFPLFSLSKLTLPHDLVRVFLLEQIYRSLHILSGGKYHHEG